MNTKIETQDGLIHLWFDTMYEIKRNKGYSKREIEAEEIKNKLQELFPKSQLDYEENGAPILKDARYPYISISHYRGLFALYFSTKSIGVDIQIFKSSLQKGKDYFINSKDEKLELSSLNLHLIWSAKEAFYKKYKGNILDLKNEVSVIEIDLKSKLIHLYYRGLTEKLRFSIYEDFVIVWT